MKILVRVRKAKQEKLKGKMKLRKPGSNKRYWTESPEEADDKDPRIIQLLNSGDLIKVTPKKKTLTVKENEK